MGTEPAHSPFKTVFPSSYPFLFLIINASRYCNYMPSGTLQKLIFPDYFSVHYRINDCQIINTVSLSHHEEKLNFCWAFPFFNDILYFLSANTAYNRKSCAYAVPFAFWRTTLQTGYIGYTRSWLLDTPGGFRVFNTATVPWYHFSSLVSPLQVNASFLRVSYETSRSSVARKQGDGYLLTVITDGSSYPWFTEELLVESGGWHSSSGDTGATQHILFGWMGISQGEMQLFVYKIQWLHPY